MSAERNGRNAEILALIQRLSDEIKLAEKHSLDATARLLKITILDLRSVAYSISDDELQSFADALEDSLFNDKLTGQLH